MSALKIYSQPFLGPCGHAVVNTLVVSAQHPGAHYNGYPYLFAHTSPARPRLPISKNFPRLDGVEWVARSRRCLAFADASGLTAVKNSKPHRKLHSELQSNVHLDHVSYWRSPLGARYLLVEPYFDFGALLALNKKGYAVIELPISLSPYCGRWSTVPGAVPATKSFLISNASNAAELHGIASALAAALASTPAWNDTAGITKEVL